MSLDELIEVNRRIGLIDFEVKRDKNKPEYSFAETEPANAEFIFFIKYGDSIDNGPTLTMLGYGNYSKFLLTASTRGTVTIGVIPPLMPELKKYIGRDAHALVEEFSKFPGFMNLEEEKKKLGLK